MTPPDLSEIRRQLRAQGYLDAGLERAIFTAPRAFGAIAPSVVAAAAACALASAAAAEMRGGVRPEAGAWILFLLLAALELPIAAAAGALLYGASRLFPAPRSPRRASLLAAIAAAGGVFALLTFGARSLVAGIGGHPGIAVLLVTLAAFVFARLVRATALSLALRRQVELPERPAFRLAAAAVVAGLLGLSLLLGWAAPAPVPFPSLSVRPAARPLVVIGLDGVAPSVLRALVPAGVVARWRRPPGPPPEVWTTMATGVESARHGVAAFERAALPGGVSVRPPLGVRWAFRGPLHWLGVARRLPVSGEERRAYDFWEIASRCGIPTVAVNWWASDPVPGAAVVGNREIARRASSGAGDDAAAVAAFEAERARRDPMLATVYLAGADIARSSLTDPARGLLGRELARASAGREDLLVVADAGRRGDRGAMWAPGAPAEFRAAATDVAPTILARLGIPAARDLDGEPIAGMAPAGEPPTVPTYGTREAPRGSAENRRADQEYLKRLRSLGYLN